jgi:hypothetical protein
MHKFREEARRNGYGSDSAVTSASNSPQFGPSRFNFNPEARPFIPGAFSHPPMPTEENQSKSGTSTFYGSRLDPTAPPFVRSPSAFYLPPRMRPQSPRGYFNLPEDPIFDSFADAIVFHGTHQQQDYYQYYDQHYDQTFDLNAGYGYPPGFANAYEIGYAYTPTQYFAAPATQPIFAVNAQHAIDYVGFDAGRYSIRFRSTNTNTQKPRKEPQEDESQEQED